MLESPGGWSPEGHEALRAVDGDPGTSWVDLNRTNGVLVMSYRTSEAVEVGWYRVEGAKDGLQQVPASWVVEGSHSPPTTPLNSRTWVVLDEVVDGGEAMGWRAVRGGRVNVYHVRLTVRSVREAARSGANELVADEATFVLPEDAGTRRVRMNETAVYGRQGSALYAWLSWRNIPTPGKGAVRRAVIELVEAGHGNCTGKGHMECLEAKGCYWNSPHCSACTRNQQVYVYATHPVTECVGKGKAECPSVGCVWDVDPLSQTTAKTCLPLRKVAKAKGGVQGQEKCNVPVPQGRGVCPHGSVYSVETSRCECGVGGECLATGRCHIVGSTPGGPCTYNVTWEQQASDALRGTVCEKGMRYDPVYSLRYTWRAEDVDGSLANYLDSTTDTGPPSNWAEELLWNGAFPNQPPHRFYFEVASYEQGPPVEGMRRTVDITEWLTRHTAHLGAGDVMDLSFVVVAIPGGPDKATQCHPSFYLNDLNKMQLRPRLLLKSTGHHQPDRLFYAMENTRLSAHQHGHPFYSLRTVDSPAGLRGGEERVVMRYTASDVDRAGGPNATVHCNGPVGCPCPMEAAFQDPTDFTQIGEYMYFLATSDWERRKDDSPSCSHTWETEEAEGIFQGSREIFFTRGLPGRNPRHAAQRTQDDTVSTRMAKEARFGDNTHPAMNGDTVEELVGMRVFTRAKELMKVADPLCDPSAGCPYAAEMLVFVSTTNAGEPRAAGKTVTVSELMPRLWKLRVHGPHAVHAGHPVGPPEVVAPLLRFPAYLTVTGRDVGGVRKLFIMLLAEEDTGEGVDDLAPGTRGGEVQHQYHVARKMSVWAVEAGATTQATRVAGVTGRNVAKCRHMQGHPGFVEYKGAVYFHYDPDGKGVRLYRWGTGAEEAEEVRALLSPDGSRLRTVIPPLNKGYFLPAVVGESLLLSLAEEGVVVGAEADPGDCLELPSETCDVCGEKEETLCASASCRWAGGMCVRADGVNENVHEYQKGFACIEKSRGEVELWLWNVERKEARKVGDAVPGVPTDPKWVHQTGSGVFWVGHDEGMTNTGARLSETVGGIRYPERQYVGWEKQSLWFAPHVDGGLGEAVRVWGPQAPVEMYGFTEWRGRVYFWSYDPEPLLTFYERRGGWEGSACYPPGREQEVQYVSSQGEWHSQRVLSGVNVPAYDGCPRVLYSVPANITEPTTPIAEVVGGSEDGVGVPHRHCCEHTESGGGRWPKGDNILQAGRLCKVFGETGEVDTTCTGNFSSTTTLARGCLDCSVRGGGGLRGFSHPRATPLESAQYSTSRRWTRPASGWWFAGHHNTWGDKRACKTAEFGRCPESHPRATLQGAYCNNSAVGVACPHPPCVGFAYRAKCLPGETTVELYRPGGFAWREGWPRVMAVWEEQRPPQRDTCDDCKEMWYGPTCRGRCPAPDDLCRGKQREECMEGPCEMVGDECQAVPCSGDPCNDGVLGNGTCLCRAGRTGTACQYEGAKRVEHTVDADAGLEGYPPSAGEGAVGCAPGRRLANGVHGGCTEGKSGSADQLAFGLTVEECRARCDSDGLCVQATFWANGTGKGKCTLHRTSCELTVFGSPTGAGVAIPTTDGPCYKGCPFCCRDEALCPCGDSKPCASQWGSADCAKQVQLYCCSLGVLDPGCAGTVCEGVVVPITFVRKRGEVCGHPTAQDCAETEWRCGKSGDEPCCGRSPEPLQAGYGKVAVFAFVGLPPMVGKVEEVVVEFHEADGACRGPNHTEVLVYKLEGARTGEWVMRPTPSTTVVEHGLTAGLAGRLGLWNDSRVVGRFDQTTPSREGRVRRVALHHDVVPGGWQAWNLTVALTAVTDGQCDPLYKPREYLDSFSEYCGGRSRPLCPPRGEGKAVPISPTLTARLSVTYALPTVVSKARRAKTLMAPPAGPDGQQQVQLQVRKNETADAQSGFSLMQTLCTGSVAECRRMAPLGATFVLVQVLALKSGTNYSLAMNYTPGSFVKTDTGYCQLEDLGTGGVVCKGVVLEQCNAVSCPPEKGQCVPDPSTRNSLWKCECKADRYGAGCDVVCTAEATCSGHGGCHSVTGKCMCYANDTMGYWEGERCDTCKEGYYGASCRNVCLETGCVYGRCNKMSGRCEGECMPNYTGERCNECKTGWYPPWCRRHCDTETTCRNGMCSAIGVCMCDEGYYMTPSRSLGCVAHCNATTTCNGKGRCPDEGSVVFDPTRPCECYASDDDGYYNRETNCSTCDMSHYGEGCQFECWCNLRGYCEDDGRCRCFDDDIRGHFEGERCERCRAGYTGEGCTSQATLEPRLSKGRPFFGEKATEKKDGVRRVGAVMHTTVETTTGVAHELIYASAGTRPASAEKLEVEVWGKVRNSSLNFDKAWWGQIGVHTKSAFGELLGEAVLGIVSGGPFVHFVVNDSRRAYVGRVWAADDAACKLCTVPTGGLVHMRLGDERKPLDASRSCGVQGCGVGTMVTGPKGERGVVTMVGGPNIEVTTRTGTIDMDPATLTPVSGVMFLDAIHNSDRRYDVVGWGLVSETSQLYVTMRETLIGGGLAGYHLVRVRVDQLQPVVVTTTLQEFAKDGSLHSILVAPAQGHDIVLLFGEVGGVATVQRHHSVKDGGITKVLNTKPHGCTLYSCNTLPTAVRIGDEALVFLEVGGPKGVAYVAQRFSISDPRGPEKDVQCSDAKGECMREMIRLLDLRLGTEHRVGIGSVTVDEDFGYMYLAMGTGVEPSVVYKIDTATLRINYSRVMEYGKTTAEAETVVAAVADKERRGLLAVVHTARTGVVVINMYDVNYITPDVADGMTRGTVVVVHGTGIVPLGDHPLCRMGLMVEKGVYVRQNNKTLINCTAEVPPSYTACDVLSLEVSLSDKDVRWTETAVPIRRIDTPIVLEVGTNPKPCWDPGWVEYVERGRNEWRSSKCQSDGHRPNSAALRKPLSIDGVARGPVNESVTLTVQGAAFINTTYMRCRIDGKVTPATFVAPQRILCAQPRGGFENPLTTTVEVTMDGQIFSNNSVPYHIIGPASGMNASFGEGKEIFMTASSDTVYMNITVELLDEVGHFIADVWKRKTLGMVTLSGRTVTLENVEAQHPSSGKVVFRGVKLVNPTSGEHTLTATYYEEGNSIFSKNLTLVVSEGDAHLLSFNTPPPEYSNNREELSPQPRIQVRDQANNIVGEQLNIKVALGTLPAELKMRDGEPLVKLTGDAAVFNETTGTYDFKNLMVQANPQATGRRLQYRTVQTNVGDERGVLVKFPLRFELKVGNKTLSISHEMHMVDCSARYIGDSEAAWTEPEEQYVSEKGKVGQNITVKGWKFSANERYCCRFRAAASGDDEGVSVEGHVMDSCTLLCTPPEKMASAPGMVTVQVVSGCQSCERDCDGSTSANSWFLHRFVGKENQLEVWNIERTVLSEAKAQVNPYGEMMLQQQLAVGKLVAVDPTLSNGLRFLESGKYSSTWQQGERADFRYRLMMYSSIAVNEVTVLRAAVWTTLAGRQIWTDPEKEWEHAETVRNMNRSSPPLDMRLRVGITDGAQGLYGWRGNWVAGHKTLDALQKGNEGKKEVVELSLQVVRREDRQPVKVWVGNRHGNYIRTTMENGYAELEEVRIPHPKKGTYEVTLSAVGLTATRLFRVAEGLPHRVVFDSPEWGGEEGRPLSTLTSPKELITQPRFRLLDVAHNTLKDLPSAHDIRVRVKSVIPWPRCVSHPCADVAEGDHCQDHNKTTDGMWGNPPPKGEGSMCRWYTPPTDTTDEAKRQREKYDPQFSGDGIATYATAEEKMFLWGEGDTSYTVIFEFYGEVLDKHGYRLSDLKAEGIKTSRCARSCSQTLCELDPPEVDLATSEAKTVVVYGDFFTAAKAPQHMQLQVQLAYQTDDGPDVVCVVEQPLVKIRDACSAVLTLPRKEQDCTNLNSALRKRRGVEPLQGRSVLDRPASAQVKVSTDGTAFDHLNAKRLVVKGEPVQLGVSWDMRAVPHSQRNRTADEHSKVIPITITTKDSAGNDMGAGDRKERIVQLKIERLVTLTNEWEPLPVVTANGSGSSTSRTPRLLLDNPGGNQAVMRKGSVTFNVKLQAPSATIYGVLAEEIGEGGVKPCGHICSDGKYLYTFVVKVGRPYNMHFASKPVTLIDNAAEEVTEYSIAVKDFAGNTITTDGVEQGLAIAAVFSIEVPELANSTQSSSILLKRRGEEDTPEVREKLMKQACSVMVSGEALGGLTSPAVQLRSSSRFTSVIRFTLTTFKIWNGFTCRLLFRAVAAGSATNDEKLLADELNIHTQPPLVTTVKARPCAEGQFGYSFEFGCWNRKLQRVIGGPKNAATGIALRGTSRDSPYDCLTRCGVCEEGMVCDGSTIIAAKANYWREPVGYQAFECKEDNCVGVKEVPSDYSVRGVLGPMGTPEGDRIRGWSQCKVGNIGPVCGVCDRRETEDAPSGYGRMGYSCMKCPNKNVSYVLIATLAIGLIVVVVVMVVVNLQTGPVVKENPVVSVMIRMFLNHLQVTSLTGEFNINWGSLVREIFNAKAKTSFDPSEVSVDCLAHSDFYSTFTAWVVLPGMVVLIPGVVVLLLKVFRVSKSSRLHPEVPPAIECMSPYHWVYDWQVDERDKPAMLRHIDEVARCDNNDMRIGLHSRKGWQRGGREGPQVAVKIFREDVDHRTREGVERWSANLILGEFGCGLCKRCCMLEQLFPTEGVGRVKNAVYNCTLDAHQGTLRRLRLFFKGTLLDACEARLALKEVIASKLKRAGSTMSVESQQQMLLSLFITAKDPRYKNTGRLMKEVMDEARKVQSEYKTIDMETVRAKASEVEIKRGLERQKLALSNTPPWPVKAHQSLFSTLPKKVPLTVGEDDEEINLLSKYMAAVETMTRENKGVGADCVEDVMHAEKLKTTESDSLWKVRRTDPVMGVERVWYTYTDPLTPPSTPPSKGYLELPPEPTGKEDVLPEWMLEAEFKELGRAADVARNISASSNLFPVSTNRRGEMLISIHDVAKTVSYSDLYAMTRLRRTRDKFQEWTARGYTMDRIRSAMIEHDMLQEPEHLVAAVDFKKQHSSFLNDLDSNPSGGQNDASGGQNSVPGELDHEREMLEFERVKKADKQLQVLYDCALCRQDFAVLYCPHDDEYYCEECDHILHKHGEKATHLRMKPQPRTSPLYEAGYETRLRMHKVYIVAVLVVVFLLYPSLMKMIALMLSCTEEMCVDQATCHRYLDVDPQVDCSESPYPMYRALAFLCFVVYGFGIPLLGFMALKRNRHKLKTKEVLGTLGFLYTGFREKRYYWEMVIMVRKMAVVFIVVFLSRNERYQMYAAMWTVTFFVFLNIFLSPFKYRVLWKMENLSLISIMITLNLGLLYFEDPPKRYQDALSAAIFAVNLLVLVVYVVLIVQEARRTLFELIDENGDGDLTCEEFSNFLERKFEENKPKFCRSARQVLDDEEDCRQRMLATKDGMLTTQYFEWKHGPTGPEPRESRVEWLRQAHEDMAPEKHPNRPAKEVLSFDDVQEWWKVVFSEVAASRSSSIHNAQGRVDPSAPAE